MRKSKFSEEQIIGALKQADASSVEDVCRRLGVSRNTFDRWKAKFGGMDVSEARKLRALSRKRIDG